MYIYIYIFQVQFASLVDCSTTMTLRLLINIGLKSDSLVCEFKALFSCVWWSVLKIIGWCRLEGVHCVPLHQSNWLLHSTFICTCIWSINNSLFYWRLGNMNINQGRRHKDLFLLMSSLYVIFSVLFSSCVVIAFPALNESLTGGLWNWSQKISWNAYKMTQTPWVIQKKTWTFRPSHV